MKCPGESEQANSRNGRTLHAPLLCATRTASSTLCLLLCIVIVVKFSGANIARTTHICKSMKYFIVALLLTLCACKTRQVTEQVTDKADRIERVSSTEIIRPVQRADTVIKWLKMPVSQPVRVQQGKTRLILVRDTVGNLKASASTAGDTFVVRDTFIKEVVRYREVKKEKVTRNRWGLAEWLLVVCGCVGGRLGFE